MLFSNSVYASLAQRYWNPEWSPEKNRRIYGTVASIEGIGSNLRIELGITAGLDGDEQLLDDPLAELKSKVDHRCLFAPGTAFENRPSTIENLTVYLARELFSSSPQVGVWSALTLWETDRLGCTAYPEESRVSLHIRTRNLWLELKGEVDPDSGLLIARETVEKAVQNAFVAFAAPAQNGVNKWAEELISHLRQSLEMLVRLRIDLGSQGSLVVSPG